jgi:hypothetical protein
MSIQNILSHIRETGQSYGSLTKEASSQKDLMAKVRSGKDLSKADEVKSKQNLPGKQSGEDAKVKTAAQSLQEIASQLTGDVSYRQYSEKNLEG